jgi:hypothetical protein
MARIDQLLTSYRRYVALPPKANMPLSQRVWFLVYPPDEERRMVNRVDEFEIVTRDAGRGWLRIDLAGVFADWMDTFDPEERELCLANPSVTKGYADEQFRDFVSTRIADGTAKVAEGDRAKTVFAVTGLMELFDFVHVSAVVEKLPATFPGTLLVFFPGERSGNTYRFLDARDGWDYLAVPILPES